MAAIETDSLTRQFGDVRAVDGLDLEVERGEVYGFLGPNGAGKSTTINILLGFLEPTAGEATVLGTDVTDDGRSVRARMGVLPEGFEPYERLTGREHVSYAAELAGVDADAPALLDRVGLEREAWDRRAGGYSKGMAQRLALGCALVGDPDLLVLDEPSSGLDPGGMAEMRELIRTEAERGTTVFFSSHLLPEVEAVADRVGILADGELVATGTLDELRAGTATRAPLRLDLAGVPDGLVAAVRDLPEVLSAEVEDGTLQTEVADPAVKVDVIQAVADRTDVEDVVAETPSLESMFAKYTNGDVEGDPDGPVAAATDATAAAADGGGDR